MTGIRIGVDVGGTNTDAVAVTGREILATVKHPTSDDVLEGVVAAVKQLLAGRGIVGRQVDAMMIGTTHFTNAVVEGKELASTGVVRVCSAATRAIPPMVDWPARIRGEVEGPIFFVAGGHEFDGREISPLDTDELRRVADKLHKAGVASIALSSVFSPVTADHERRVADFLEESMPDVAVSRSNEIGRIGLIERENATILNAALYPLAGRIVDAFDRAAGTLGIDGSLFLTQNDGTLMAATYTRTYPIATFASGPTNSMRGAAFLSDQKDCAVIDIGGTTTDIGMLRNGFPRQAPLAVDIGGVRTNFRMPDLLSVGIGGGSIVRNDHGVTVGPDSVGHRLTREARVFGGETLTATDVAVAAGLAHVGDPARVTDLDPQMVAEAVAVIRAGIADGLDRMKTGPEPIPVVLVGGGAILLGDDLPGASRLIRPAHQAVANAVGAAMSQVGGHVDRIVTMEGVTRAEAIARVRSEAEERCADAGADPQSIEVVEVDEVPLAYLPSTAVRMTVRAVGHLA